MFTKFGHHLSNVQKALGIELNTFNIMDSLDLAQFDACHLKKARTPFGSHDHSCTIEDARFSPLSSPFLSLIVTL
jgi:hypothetical protein